MSSASITSRDTQEYKDARSELKEAEAALVKQVEHVAELRRNLPKGAVVDDYVFEEWAANSRMDHRRHVRFSDLFKDSRRNTVVIIHMMFGNDSREPCPMCEMWAHGFVDRLPDTPSETIKRFSFTCEGILMYNAAASYIREAGCSIALVAKCDVDKLRAFADQRGWKNIRILSSNGNTFNADIGCETTTDPPGQLPGVSVFTQNPENGEIRRFWTSERSFAYEHHRALDLFSPVWNLLDCTPEGREEYIASSSGRPTV